MNFVEVRPLKPFCGTFKCPLSMADSIEDVLEEKDGVIVKVRQPMKRYAGFVSVARQPMPEEFAAWKAGKVSAGYEFSDDGKMLFKHPDERTLKLPEDLASSLVERGLAERVTEGMAPAAPTSAVGSMRVIPNLGG